MFDWEEQLEHVTVTVIDNCYFAIVL